VIGWPVLISGFLDGTNQTLYGMRRAYHLSLRRCDLRCDPGAHQPAHSSNPKANFTLVPRISAETNPINVKERSNVLLGGASC